MIVEKPNKIPLKELFLRPVPGKSRSKRYLRKRQTSHILYPVLVYAFLLIAGTIPILIMDEDNPAAIAIFQLILFLTTGLYHTFEGRDKYPIIKNNSQLQPLMLTIGLGFLLLLSLGLVYIFWLDIPLLPAAAFSAALVLPDIIHSHWKIYGALPENRFTPWYHPGTEVDKRASISINSISISFRVRAGYYDQDFLVKQITVPARTTVGKAFHQFLDKQNALGGNRVEIADHENLYYGWEFSLERLRGASARYLDPEKSLAENKVQSNMLIIARRLRKNTP